MPTRDEVIALVEASDGVLNLDPAWVARDWVTPGRRLGLTDEQCDVGERGSISERWLASTTPAANAVTYDGEGISTVTHDGKTERLDHILEAAPDVIMGAEYAKTHDGLGRLAKIFDFGERVPYHIHPPAKEAEKVGLNSKDEAYYFLPGANLGPHPESFFGVHSSLSEEEARQGVVEHLKKWEGASIIALSKGYHLFSEGGYFVPSGVLHSPGTALTLELQEDSDAMAFLQAQCGENHLSKDLLYGVLDPDEVEARGEDAVTDWIDWDLNRDPDFHSRFHIGPHVFEESDGVEVAWILYGSEKFTAKRYRVRAGSSVTMREPGAYSVLLWTGSATLGGKEFHGGVHGQDEALITYDRATAGVEVTAQSDLEMIAFFGPDLHPQSPAVGAA